MNREKAKQMASDDLANGEITKDQLERQTEIYLRWLEMLNQAIYH